MKKIMLLPALGAAAALTWGAASSLTVNNGAPLQVGQGGGLRCADSAKVVAWGYDDAPATGPAAVAYAFVDVTDNDNDCDNNWLYVTPLDANNNALPLIGGGYSTGSVQLGSNSTRTPAGVTRYQVFFGTNADQANPGSGGTVSAEALESVRISIDQGQAMPNLGP